MESFKTIPPETLSADDLTRGRDQVVDQMNWARQYSLQLIESIPYELWYVQPAGAATNVAWQVGHLAVSQYGLMLFRQRGRQPEDRKIMPSWLRKQFGRSTNPLALSKTVAEPDKLLDLLSSVHQQSIDEVRQLQPEQLLEPVELPYAAYPIKLGALLFCPIHEAIHTGQIGVLRRMHGLDPLR